MDYSSFVNVANNLLTNFGNGSKCTLRHVVRVEGTKRIPVTEDIEGKGVLLGYSDEVITKENGVVNAGDVKIIAQLSERPVIGKDKMIMEDGTYNIIACRQVAPTGTPVIIYIMQCRRA